MMMSHVVMVTSAGQCGLSHWHRRLHLDRSRRGSDLLHLTTARLLLHNEWQCVCHGGMVASGNVAITPVICLHLWSDVRLVL